MPMLEPIERETLGEAHALLARGFPMRKPDFWTEGLERLMAHHAASGLGPIGQIMRMKGESAGVMLTIRSRRADGGSVVNLSSWYVDPRFRLLAPRMLTRVLEEPADVFTDLTPSPAVTEMIGRFGFVQRHAGALLVALPVAAFVPGGGARILDGIPDSAEAVMLAGHRDLGCLVLRLITDDGEMPLVVSVASRRGLPVARIIYATDLAAVRGAIGPIARHLLARGLAVLELPADPGDHVPGGWFTRRARPTFFRGTPPAAAVDHAYSEFVFLRI
ncbi:hypothetical protein [Phreatobacter sp.]|uniref:hypothetical protein n=1 Tax=Phreatobacter sp. TaxID=1966341 RepID=UPI0022C6CED0|nr:hypothetical protein [Phreatobacter sp.]MCZ8313798.1 hypothetical protein [Phreatobacter sp.]